MMVMVMVVVVVITQVEKYINGLPFYMYTDDRHTDKQTDAKLDPLKLSVIVSLQGSDGR